MTSWVGVSVIFAFVVLFFAFMLHSRVVRAVVCAKVIRAVFKVFVVRHVAKLDSRFADSYEYQ